MANSRDPRKPTRFHRGAKRYGNVGGHSPPDDTLENTRDHERIWFELKRSRSCCDCPSPGFRYCFETFDYGAYICDGEFPGGETLAGFWTGRTEIDSSWYLPPGCTGSDIRPANLTVPVNHPNGSWRNSPYSDLHDGVNPYQANLQSAGFNWSNFFPAEDRTLEAWIKPTASDISNGRCFILGEQAGVGIEKGGLNVYFRSNGAVAIEHIEIGAAELQISNPGWWEADQWHHFVLVRNAETETIAVFINGKLAISRYLPATGWDTIDFPAVPSIYLQWAAWSDLAYYTSALSATTIRRHYQAIYGVEGVPNPIEDDGEGGGTDGDGGGVVVDPGQIITEPLPPDLIDGVGAAGSYLSSNGDVGYWVTPEDSPFELEERKGVADGYASLDADVLVPDAQLGSGTPTRSHFLRGDRVWEEGQIVPEPDSDGQILVAAGGISEDYVAAVLASVPNYYWKLIETGNPPVSCADLGANNKPMAPTSDPTNYTGVGPFSEESPLDFDTGDSLSATLAHSGTGKVFSVSAFIRLNALPGANARIFSHSSIGLYVQPDGTLLNFCSTRPDLVSATALELGRWYHVAAVWNTSNFGGGSTYRRIIIDGVQDANVASAQDPSSLSTAAAIGGTLDGQIAHVAYWYGTAIAVATFASHLDTRGRVWVPSDLGELDAGIEVSKNGVDVSGDFRRRIDLVEGTGITLTVTDDPGADSVEVEIESTGGGGVPDPSAEPDGQVLTVLAGAAVWDDPPAGGGGVGAVSSAEWTPPLFGKPDSFSGALDTDFDGSLGPWTAVAGSAAAVNLLETADPVTRYDLTTLPGCLLLQAADADRVFLRADYTLADGESVIIPVFPSGPPSVGGDNMNVSVVLNESDDADPLTGNYVRLMVEQDTTEWVVQGNSSADASGQEILDAPGGGGPGFLLRIVRSGTTYSMFVSTGGGSWQYVYQRTGVGTPYANVWILLEGGSTLTYAPIVAIPWTKLGDSGFLPWTAEAGGEGLPDYSGAAEGDVLTIDTGAPVWAAPSGGGGGGGRYVGSAIDTSLRSLTANNTWEDITGATLGFTAVAGKAYFVTIEALWRGTTSNWGHHGIRCRVDGATTGVDPVQKVVHQIDANYPTTVHQLSNVTFIVTGLSAGAHTVQFQSNDLATSLDRAFRDTRVIIVEMDV